MNKNKLAVWFLRIGLIFVYMYATIEIYLSPDNFLKYVPSFMLELVPIDLFLFAFGVFEIALSIWLLTGWKGEYAAIVSFLMMVGIVAFNGEYFQILFRNVAIGFGSLALAALEITSEESKETVTA